MNPLKFVKALVFILTLIIFGGSLILLGRIAKEVKKPKNQLPHEIILNEPEGSHIKQIATEDKKLYILMSDENNSDYIIVFDTEQGKKISNIKVD